MTSASERKEFNVFQTELAGCQLIEASAGTGKTWSSTGLYLRMVVEQDLLPEHILVVTFTKAATAELNGRIRQRLRDMQRYLNGERDLHDKDFFAALAAQWGSDAGLTNALINRRLQQALSGFDKAAIFTIHAFCQHLLNDYAFEAAARFNLTAITDDSEYLDLVACDFWRKHMASLTAADRGWLHWLVTEKQSPQVWLKKIQNYKSKPYLSLLTKVRPEPLSKNTAEFFEEAKSIWADDSAEIVRQLRSALENDLNARSYAVKKRKDYLDDFQQLLNLNNDEFYWTELSEKCAFSALKSKLKKNKQAPEHVFFTLLDDVLAARQQQSDLYAYRRTTLLQELLAYINLQLPQEKANQGELAFDDMLLNVYHALNGAQGKAFANAVATQFRSALIDEFQDTDPLQLTIFSKLFVDTQTPLFYVGDPKQAIYSFRGADIFAYYQAAQKTDQQLTLKTNYRSTPALVDSVNALFSTETPNHAPFMAAEIQFDWVASKPKERLVIEGEDGTEKTDQALQFAIALSEDGKALARTTADPWAAEYSAEKISHLLKLAAVNKAIFVNDKGEQRPLRPADIAVLVPRHIDGDRVVEQLRLRGVACVQQGPQKVLKTAAAQTMLRLMQAVAEPSNDSRIIELLGDYLVGGDALALAQLREQGEAWESVLNNFWELRVSWLEKGFSAMFRQWLSQLDGQGFTLPERLLQLADGERHLTDLMHLAEILQSRSRQQQGGVNAMVNWLQHAVTGDSKDDEHQLRLESDSQRVKIVTLHASKGLEYNVVFCPFLWAGKQAIKDDIVTAHKDGIALLDFGSPDFEENTTLANREQLMEQLRLLYVALTRPVHRCYIFWAKLTATGQSALAWLLYGDADMMAGDPVQALSEKVKRLSQQQFVEGVVAFCDSASSRQPQGLTNQASVAYQILKRQQGVTVCAADSAASDDLQVAQLPARSIYPSWSQSSFSGLTHNQHATVEQLIAQQIQQVTERSERADDRVTSADADEASRLNEHSIFTFPRGAQPGECLHDIFEYWDFNCSDKHALTQLVASKLDHHGIAKAGDRPLWYPAVVDMVMSTLTTPLTASGFTLAQLTLAERQPEMEFLLAARGSVSRIKKILQQPIYQLPEIFVAAASQLDDARVNGYLIGFIDLVLKDDEGRYGVLDWKSNHLGMQAEDYSVGRIEQAMAESHYYLQALLYLVALHRYLTAQLPGYKIDSHLGGAWYLFVRGINGEAGNGIYHYRPPAELIMALDQALQRPVLKMPSTDKGMS